MPEQPNCFDNSVLPLAHMHDVQLFDRKACLCSPLLSKVVPLERMFKQTIIDSSTPLTSSKPFLSICIFIVELQTLTNITNSG